MKIFEFNSDNIKTVAKFMANIKPDWWDYDGALGQIGSSNSDTVGWFIGEDNKTPKGWLFCQKQALYSCLEIECLGYDDNGKFALEHKLLSLFEKAEEYAKANGFRILKTGMGTRDLSCHGRKLGEYWKELRDLKSLGRLDFDWLIDYGFKPSGILPNCYEKGWHCIIFVKELI